MIAPYCPHAYCSIVPSGEQSKDACRVRPPVDQVAKKDDRGFRRRSSVKVFTDQLDQSAEKISASMDIANGVETARPKRNRAPNGKRTEPHDADRARAAIPTATANRTRMAGVTGEKSKIA